MSLEISKLVWKRSRSRLGDRLALLAIADFADDEGNAFPSMRTLSEKTGLSERTVQTSVKNLQAMGEISIRANAGPHGVNLYQITLFDAPERIDSPRNSKERNVYADMLALGKRDGWACKYCGVALAAPDDVSHENKPSWPTRDHVIPTSRGGEDTLANMVLACGTCNSAKGAKLDFAPRKIRTPQTLHPANDSTPTGNPQHGYRKSTTPLPENPAPKRSLTINKRSRTVVAFADLKVPDSLKTAEFETAWNIWAEYRKQRGLSAYVEAGANVQLAKLGKIGSARAIAAIEHSMAQNYQGIYEAKQNGTHANTSTTAPANNNCNRDAAAGYRAHGQRLALGLGGGGTGNGDGKRDPAHDAH